MDDALFVRGVKARSQLNAELQDFDFCKRTAAKFRIERQAGDVLGHKIVDAFVSSEVESHGDMRIGNLGEAQCFVAKLALRKIAQQGESGKSFNGDIPIETFVMSAKHDAHAARANLFDNAVV